MSVNHHFLEAVRAAQHAVSGGSNDAEIAALWDAVYAAADLLGIDI